VGLPGSGTRLGERGEEVRGVRTVATGQEREGRMTLEGAAGVRVRPRVGGGEGGVTESVGRVGAVALGL